MLGFDYVAAGNSTSKKAAQSNAAKDFLNYLVREGKVREQDVPGDAVSQAGGVSQCSACPRVQVL